MPIQQEQSDKSRLSEFYSRLLPFSVGAGLFAAYWPVLKAVKGDAEYWHGTPIAVAHSIGQTGIDIRYAGTNQRLNSILANNTVLEELGNQILALPDDSPAKKKLKELLPKVGEGKFIHLTKLRDEIFHYHQQVRGDLFGALNDSIINELLEELNKNPEVKVPEEWKSAKFWSDVRNIRKAKEALPEGSKAAQLADKLLRVAEEWKTPYVRSMKKVLTEHLGIPEKDAEKLAWEMINKSKGHYIDDLVHVANTYFKHHTGKELDTQKLEKALFERGKRIYLSQSAPSAFDWGRYGNELAIFFQKNLSEDELKQLKESKGKLKALFKVLKEGFNATTFGLPQMVEDEIINPIKYHRDAKKLSPQEISFSKDLEKVLREKGYLADPERYAAVFKTHIGKEHLKSLGTLKDFKGFEVLTGTAPLIRQFLAKVLPNYSPGRDISVGASIAPHQLKELHIVDLKTGKPVARFVNKDFKPAEKSLKEGLKVFGKHLPFVGLGGFMLYKAFAPHRGKENEQLKKKASDKNVEFTKLLIKHGLLAGAGVGLAGGVYAAFSHGPVLMQKGTDKDAWKDPKTYLGIAGLLGSTGGGLLLTSHGYKKKNPILMALGTGMFFGGLGGLAVPMGFAINPLHKVLDGDNNDLKHKVLVGAATGIPMGYVAYAIGRHYPHNITSLIHHFKQGVKSILTDINPEIEHIRQLRMKSGEGRRSTIFKITQAYNEFTSSKSTLRIYKEDLAKLTPLQKRTLLLRERVPKITQLQSKIPFSNKEAIKKLLNAKPEHNKRMYSIEQELELYRKARELYTPNYMVLSAIEKIPKPYRRFILNRGNRKNVETLKKHIALTQQARKPKELRQAVTPNQLDKREKELTEKIQTEGWKTFRTGLALGAATTIAGGELFYAGMAKKDKKSGQS